MSALASAVFRTAHSHLSSRSPTFLPSTSRTSRYAVAPIGRQRPVLVECVWGEFRRRYPTPVRQLFLAVQKRREQLAHLTVNKLKPLLKRRGLPLSGKKEELIERIISDEQSDVQDDTASAPRPVLPFLFDADHQNRVYQLEKSMQLEAQPAIEVVPTACTMGGRAPLIESYPVVDGETMRKVDIEVAGQLQIVRTCEAVAHRTADFVAYELAVPPSVLLVFVAGKGNNGQNAIAAARALHGRGHTTLLVLAHDEDALPPILQEQVAIYRAFGGEVAAALPSDLSKSVVIDGLLGHGITSAPRGRVAELIREVNERPTRGVVSLDLPSGLNHVTGEGYDPCVKATWTLVYHVVKSGNVSAAARPYAGDVYVTETALTYKAFGENAKALQEQFRNGPLARLKMP